MSSTSYVSSYQRKRSTENIDIHNYFARTTARGVCYYSVVQHIFLCVCVCVFLLSIPSCTLIPSFSEKRPTIALTYRTHFFPLFFISRILSSLLELSVYDCFFFFFFQAEQLVFFFFSFPFIRNVDGRSGCCTLKNCIPSWAAAVVAHHRCAPVVVGTIPPP